MAWTELAALSSPFLSAQVSPSRSSNIFKIKRSCSRHQYLSKTCSRPFKFKCNPVVAIPAVPPMTAEELQDAFGHQGLRFLDVDGIVAADLKLENGCKARLLVPMAHITSYTAHMWHGGDEELLHTVPSGRGKRLDKRRSDFIRGGIGLRFFQSQDPLSSILPSAESWSVEDVKCEPSNYAQMTLFCSSNPGLGITHAVQGALQFRYVVTLTDRSLSSALIITNIGQPPVEFTGSIVTHFAVSSVEGAFAVGLNGCNYRSLSTAPTQQLDKLSGASNFFSRMWGSIKTEKLGQTGTPKTNNSENGDFVPLLERVRWTRENEDCSQLHGGDDRLYPTPPTSFTLMDRGFRRSLILQRLGFQEFYLSNPGPGSKLRDWDDFICMGPAQTTQSVRLLENENWRGAQILVNPGYD